jgi:hypothetical protein
MSEEMQPPPVHAPAPGCVVLWRGYLCTVLPDGWQSDGKTVLVRRADGWMDYAITRGLPVRK